MTFKKYLTNEKIKKEFDSQFDMVNYMIHQARDMIKTGRGPRVPTDSDNIAVNTIKECALGKNRFEEPEIIEKEVELEIDNQVPTPSEEANIENS